MIEELRKAVDHLSEQDSKGLLMTILGGIDVYKENEFFDKVKHIQEELLNEYTEQSVNQGEQYHTVHFTFSRATSKNINQALLQTKKSNVEKVISFADLFAVGPITQLQKQSGFVQRYDWLQGHFHHASEKLEDFFNYYTITLLAINRISENIRIIIWSGNNAQEQTGLAYLLYLLREKRNQIYVNDISKLQVHGQTFNHTAQLPLSGYDAIFDHITTLVPLSDEKRYGYEDEWEELTSTNEKFRVMKSGKIHSVGLDYYDALILENAKKLQLEQDEVDFINVALLVNRVVDSVDEYISEAFTEYRINYLIKNGTFTKEGSTKSMNSYSVKLMS